MSVPCPKCGGRGSILTGPELLYIRLSCGHTQASLIAAEPLQRGRKRLTVSFISQVERGGRTPSCRVLDLYLRVQAEHRKAAGDARGSSAPTPRATAR